MKKVFLIVLILVISVIIGLYWLGFMPNVGVREILPLDSNITFKLTQEATKDFDGPHLFLVGRTGRGYGCGYNIITNIDSLNNSLINLSLSIEKEELGPWVGCVASSMPLGIHEELKFPISLGTYFLELHTNNDTDKYSINITENLIIIEPIESSFSILEEDMLKRIPKNVISASCSDKYNKNCVDFFKALENVTEFHVGTSKAFDFSELRTDETRYYVYTGNIQTLFDIFQKYNQQKYGFSIATPDGRMLSWSSEGWRPGLPSVLKTNISECGLKTYDIYCLIDVAADTNNKEVCERLNELPVSYAKTDLEPKNVNITKFKELCFINVGMSNLDETLCSRSSDKQDVRRCYSYIATKKNDPSVCENATGISHVIGATNRDMCYDYIARTLKNSSICEQIVSSYIKGDCLDELSLGSLIDINMTETGNSESLTKAATLSHPSYTPRNFVSAVSPVNFSVDFNSTFTSIKQVCFYFTFSDDLFDAGERLIFSSPISLKNSGFTNLDDKSKSTKGVCFGIPEVINELLDGKIDGSVTMRGTANIDKLDVQLNFND